MESIVANLARGIRVDYLERHVQRMPSVRELASKYSVSRASAQRALRVLADEGAIEVQAKRRATVPGVDSGAEPVKTDRELWLLGKIKADMDAGAIPTGTRLPKQMFWSVEHGLSLRSINRILSWLVADGYAHRRGRTIYSGPVHQIHGARSASAPPVILVLCRHHHVWQGPWTAPRTEQFCRIFADESERFAVQCRLVLVDESQQWPHYYTVGTKAFDRLLIDLQRRLLGALVAANDDTARAFHLGWIQDLGIDMPGAVSVLSFDNKFRGALFPLSSVDFGMAGLGYQAFHMIVGDLRERLCQRKEVMAQPSVIDQGSVKYIG